MSDRRFSLNGTGDGDDDSLESRLRKADEALAELYSPLAEKLAAVEQRLAKMRLPEAILLAYNDEGVPDPLPPAAETDYTWDCLAFRRHKGDWRLCHATCYSHDCEEGEEPSWKPLVECAHTVRLEAVAQLPRLWQKAVEMKEAYVARTKNALKLLDGFIND